MSCVLPHSKHSPMPRNAPIGALAQWSLDRTVAQADLAAFEELTATHAELSERDNILPFLRAHADLVALFGSYHPNISAYDRLGVEIPLGGYFIADAVIGDRARNAYCFVEYEDARIASVFALRRQRTTEWAQRFEHGFSQIVDWLWFLNDQEATMTVEEQFGPRPLDIVAVLVVGRDSGVVGIDRRRLRWRRDHVLVDSHHIYCCTYDDVVRELRARLAWAITPQE